MARIVSIRHRRKRTSEGEARPTQMAILEDGHIKQYDLETDTDELDWALGRYPIAWREVEGDEAISPFQPHHCKWRLLKKDEQPANFIPDHLRTRQDGKNEVVIKVPTRYDGLREHDQVIMVLGGSGDRFAFALSRRGETVGAKVNRVPPFVLSDQRDSNSTKDVDCSTLLRIWQQTPDAFYEVKLRDRALIEIREAFQRRQDAQGARIGCEQRLDQRHAGEVFLREDGLFPEGRIEDAFDALKANDIGLKTLIIEENRANKALDKLLDASDIWLRILSEVQGCGPRIGAGILAMVGNIQRFEVKPYDGPLTDKEKRYRQKEALSRGVEPDYDSPLTNEEKHRRRNDAIKKGSYKLCAYCGVHVRQGGKYANVPPELQFPRKLRGSVANWCGPARQSFYLLPEQWNRMPGSFWGKRLRQNKAGLRVKHPVPVVVEKNGKRTKRYTDGHIHRMACWRTITQFARWLYREWYKLEHEGH